MPTITPSLELDDTAWDNFASLALALMRGELPTDTRPEIRVADFKGMTDIATDLFEVYREQGIRGVWRTLAVVVDLNPHLVRELTADPTTLRPAQSRTVKVYTASELMALPPVTFLDAERTLQMNGITMVIGQPGSGKSLWSLRKLHGFGKDVPSLLITETQSGVGDRIRALQIATGQPMPDTFHTIMEPLNLRYEPDVDLIIAKAKEVRAKVIVFDTWAANTSGADENSVHDVQPIFNALTRIIQAVGCAILLIHHTRKDGAIYRGSSAILGSVDNMFVLTNEDGDITLKSIKTRDSSQPEKQHYRIIDIDTRFNDDGSEPVKAPVLIPAEQAKAFDASQGRIEGNQRTVLEALDSFKHGMSLQMLEDATSLSRGTVHRALQALMKGHLVRQDGYGQPYVITAEGEKAIRNQEP